MPRTEPLQPGQLHIAIIGAGATGVELAAELHNTTREFVAFGLGRIDPERDIKLSIVEAAPRILPALPERLSNSVLELLHKLKVEVLTGERVMEVSEHGIKTATGRALPAELVVWAAGIKAPDFLKDIDGLETNRINQLVVTRELQTTRDPEHLRAGRLLGLPLAREERLDSAARPVRAPAGLAPASRCCRATCAASRSSRSSTATSDH